MTDLTKSSIQPSMIIVNTSAPESRVPTAESHGIIRACFDWLLRRRQPTTQRRFIAVDLSGHSHADSLSREQLDDLREILRQLGESAVPSELDTGFVSTPESWYGTFKQIRTIRSQKLVVYYVVGMGGSFLEWAFTFQPDLYTLIEPLTNGIVVIVNYYEPI